jgi:6-phosphogluconolactonase
MSVHWYTSPDPKAAAEACAHQIVSLLDTALSGQDHATMAISGGSTPRLLFQQLVGARFGWDRVHVFWVDERCVPPTDPRSNYLLAEEHLIGPGHIPHRHVHRVYGEMTPDAAAHRYAEEIRQFFGLEEGELPHFDVIHLGLGSNVHTASLFPGEPLIEDRDRIAAAVHVDDAVQWRVTLLPGVLLAAKHTVFLVAGEDKAQAVHSVFHEEYDPKKYPAQVASHHGRKVTWFLDQAAARLMD